MARPLLAAVDIGSTWTKLVLYDEELRPLGERREPTPRTGPGRYSPVRVAEALLGMAREARDRGARAVGVSLFRASPLAWLPGPRALTPVISWLDHEARREAWSRLPWPARAASRLPLLGRALRPESPLPLMALLSREHPDARVWTLDAFVAELLEGRYVSTASNASLTGAVSPWSLRPMRLTTALAGARLETPEVAPDTLGGRLAASIVADQQAAMIGLGVTGPGRVKLAAGTGCFAGSFTGERPPLSGGVPLVVWARERRLGGYETSVPGLGLALEWAAGLLGGFRALEERARCDEWRGGLVLRLGPWPGRTVYLGPPEGESVEGLACAAIMGAAVQCALAASEHSGAIDIVGGASKPRLLRLAVASLVRAPVRYCPWDPSPRGAAYLAGLARGLLEWPPPEPRGCEAVEPASRDPSLARLARSVVEGWSPALARELRDALAEAVRPGL